MAIPKEQRRSTVTRQIRILGLSTLAVLAVGVAMSASASAHEFLVCQEGGTEHFESNLCAKKGGSEKWSHLPIAAGKSFEVEGKGGISKLEGTLKYNDSEREPAKAVIECESELVKVTLEPKGEAKTTITLAKCVAYFVSRGTRVAEVAECKVRTAGEAAGTIKITGSDLIVTGKGGGAEDEIKLGTPPRLYLAVCPSEGSYKGVEGSTICSLSEAELGLAEHELRCSSSGSSLDLGEKPVGLISAAEVKIVGTGAGSSWYAE
jgi:hypothetical protein